jgi:lipoprotein-anchoring transpeptidase ErfK/SrfK
LKRHLLDRPRTFLAASGVALVATAVALYAWDAGRGDVIAEGVRVGGVGVGGLDRAQARAKLAHALTRHLARPVLVRSGGRTWELGPRLARVRVDIRAAVEQAVNRSRRGSIFARTARAIGGSDLNVNIAPRVSYSQRATGRFVQQIQRQVDRPATDATVRPVASRLEKVPGRDGVALEAGLLTREVARALSETGADRSISAPMEVVRPKVQLRDLNSRYPNYIVINRSRFELSYFHRLKLAKTYQIAVGRQGLETTAGLYEVQEKQVNPSWLVPNSPWAGSLAGRVIPPGPEDPLKARWLGFNGSAGIHGTDDLASLGTAASHGCIRMSIPDVEQLYRRVPVHTPVYVL